MEANKVTFENVTSLKNINKEHKRKKTLVKQVMKRDLGLCRCCGFKASEVHHVIPIIYGGNDELKNMVSICHECHRKAPDDKKEFKEYIDRGGARLQFLIGISITEIEKLNLNFHEYYPLVKQIINWCRDVDKTNALEKYNLKESLEIDDVDWNSRIQ